ncbi:MAG: hypothetical protein HC815_01535 [Richelia sp. RM1_1_1]|nr:hypothetical protein [Richelia sp. RM1_1_1]
MYIAYSSIPDSDKQRKQVLKDMKKNRFEISCRAFNLYFSSGQDALEPFTSFKGKLREGMPALQNFNKI